MLSKSPSLRDTSWEGDIDPVLTAPHGCGSYAARYVELAARGLRIKTVGTGGYVFLVKTRFSGGGHRL